MNYAKLLAKEPYKFETELVNSLAQTITFYECPTWGDGRPVICVCHDLQLAAYSAFYELNDMTAEHKEYEPLFVDGQLKYGYEVNP